MTTINTAATIIIETPHRGSKRVWSSFDNSDLLNRLREHQSRHDDGEIVTEDGDELAERLAYNGYDLSRQDVITYADRDVLDLDVYSHEAVAAATREAIRYGWVIEVRDEENTLIGLKLAGAA